jgi:Lamin Tail Domain
MAVKTWLLILCAAGCTRPNPFDTTRTPTDSGLAPAPGVDLLVAPGVDLLVAPGADLSSTSRADLAAATRADLASASGMRADLAVPPGADLSSGGACGVVINELLLSVQSDPSNEYVELFNTCETDLSLMRWKLVSRSAANNQSSANGDTLLVNDLNKTILARGFLMFGHSQPMVASDGVMANGLSETAGGVALVDPNGSIVDSVAYGPVVATHNFIEGMPALVPPVAPAPGNSLVRLPDGRDSDDNAADFSVSTKPTPRAANQ